MNHKIRSVTRADINDLKKVVDSSGLFPSEYLEGMMEVYFNHADTQDIWFTCVLRTGSRHPGLLEKWRRQNRFTEASRVGN